MIKGELKHPGDQAPKPRAQRRRKPADPSPSESGDDESDEFYSVDEMDVDEKDESSRREALTRRWEPTEDHLDADDEMEEEEVDEFRMMLRSRPLPGRSLRADRPSAFDRGA